MPEPLPFRMASMSAAAIDLLQREISNPDTQWSLGTFGAIAEFSRDPDEPVRLVQSAEAVSAVTPRGGIALKPACRYPPLRVGGHHQNRLESAGRALPAAR